MDVSLPDILFLEANGMQGQLAQLPVDNDGTTQQGLDFSKLMDLAAADTTAPEVILPQVQLSEDFQSLRPAISPEIQMLSAGETTVNSSVVKSYLQENISSQRILSTSVQATIGTGESSFAEKGSSQAQLIAALVSAKPAQSIEVSNPQTLETKKSLLIENLTTIESRKTNTIEKGGLTQLFQSPQGKNELISTRLTSQTLLDEENKSANNARDSGFLTSQYNRNEHQPRQVNSKIQQNVQYDWQSPAQNQIQGLMQSQLSKTDVVLSVMNDNKAVDQPDISVQNQLNNSPISASIINRVAPVTTQEQNVPLQSYIPITNTDVISKQIEIQIKNQGKVAEIQLDPPALGRVQVHVRINGDQTIIEMNAHHTAGREALIQEMPRLKEILQSQGIEFASININLSNDQSSGYFGQQTDSANFQSTLQENKTELNENMDTHKTLSLASATQSGISLFA